MKPYLKFSLLFLTGAFASSFSYGQEPQKKPAITKIAKFKPPVVKSALGVNTNNSNVTVDEANQLVTLPLKITDAQNNIYPIDSYNFLYKRKGVVEDEETGRKQIKFTTVSDVFRKTPLPKVWVDNIQNGFQKDEEILFFDIVVKDKTGRRFFAPDLKITIQNK